MIRNFFNHTLQTYPRHHEKEPQARHQENNSSKAISSLLPINISTKLEKQKVVTKQNKDQTQNSTDNGRNNKK